MSLRIYLDDCAYAKALVVRLRAAAHEVFTPVESGLSGKDDDLHFRYAASQGLVLLTKDPEDFDRLHQANPQHGGVLAIHQDNDASRDMSYADIVRAIANLENAGVPIPGHYYALNSWRY